jgi:hypothetical protein
VGGGGGGGKYVGLFFHVLVGICVYIFMHMYRAHAYAIY